MDGDAVSKELVVALTVCRGWAALRVGGILQGLGAMLVSAESPVSVVRLPQVHCLDLPHQALCQGWGLVAVECPLPVFMVNNGRKDNCDDDGVPCPARIYYTFCPYGCNLPVTPNFRKFAPNRQSTDRSY